MSHESDADRTTSVSDDEVRVEKSFADDEFPVPAVKFRLTSESDDPAHVRLVDQIPEDFPMEGVGFHPDYESDNWTAYKDHRVEYERTLDPGEETTTVYGIRLEQASDVEGFLGEPILERPPAPADGEDEESPRDVEDILGTDRSQLVRDALQGNGRLAVDSDVEPEPKPPVSGDEPVPAEGETPVGEPESTEGEPSLDEPSAADEEAGTETESAASTSSGAPEESVTDDASSPRELEAGLTLATQRRGEDRITAVAPAESDDATEGDVGAKSEQQAADEKSEPGRETGDDGDAEQEAVDDETVDDETVEADETVEEHVDTPGAATDQVADEAAETETATGTAAVDAEGGLAATLAAEIRAGEVSESDLETLRGELDAGLPRSADVRIRRVQAQMEDLNAYADAIAEFIDEEGTGAELVERLDTELNEITDELDDLRESVEAAESDRTEIRRSVAGVDRDVDAVEERLGEVATQLDDTAEVAEDAAAGVDELHDRADGIEERLGRTTDRVDEVDSAVRDVSADVDDVAADVDDVAGEVENVASDIDETSAHVSRLDEEMGDVREDIAAIDGDVVDTRESLEAELDDLRAEVSALSNELDRIGSIEREIEELQQFRDRLNSAFGPGE